MFFFRADANAAIGAGHLMRCLTVAEALADLWGREEICFVCAEEPTAELAAQQGFRTFVLGMDYRKMESELGRWDTLFSAYRTSGVSRRPVIVVDSYFVTDRYLTALREKGFLVLLDDFGTRCYPVDCVVNYNAPARLEEYRQLYRGLDVKLLIGSSFTPVRKQFCDRNYQVRRNVRAVLITAGGGDRDNIAGAILERIYDEAFCFYVVTGRFNPNLDLLRDREARSANVHICYDVKDMAGLMKKCDVAVTAGGSTVYELAALGIPFICFSCAENQEMLTDYIRQNGIAQEAGAWHKDAAKTLERLAEMFGHLARDQKLRLDISAQAKHMIDCKGALRLADQLSKCAVCP